MDKHIKVAAKIKAGLSRPSGVILKDFSKGERRLIKAMLYGIQATKGMKLSDISPSLHEEAVLIQRGSALSEFGRGGFFPGVHGRVSPFGRVGDTGDAVIALDFGDIRKRHAQRGAFM